LFHLCTVEAQTPAQKLSVILCASFNMLRRPLVVIATQTLYMSTKVVLASYKEFHIV
jgi:hypothetical protein